MNLLIIYNNNKYVQLHVVLWIGFKRCYNQWNSYNENFELCYTSHAHKDHTNIYYIWFTILFQQSILRAYMHCYHNTNCIYAVNVPQKMVQKKDNQTNKYYPEL